MIGLDLQCPGVSGGNDRLAAPPYIFKIRKVTMDSDAMPARSQPALSVVVLTYREAPNLPEVFERAKAVLEGLPWEKIVVDDDSPDGTSEVAFALAASDRACGA
jgi:hypothetical protein